MSRALWLIGLLIALVAIPDLAFAQDAQVHLRQITTDGASTSWADRALSLFGLAVLIGLGALFSTNRKAINWRTIGWGVGLQLFFGVLVLKTSPGRSLFSFMNDLVAGLLRFSDEGASFLFGNLLKPNIPVGPANGPYGAIESVEMWGNTGALMAFSVLPTIIFFSCLMSVLYHLGAMQPVVKAFAWLMARTMKTSGAESLSAASNIFVGQTEAPLVIRPFVNTMTKSELMAVMTGGLATVAGGVLAAYVGMLQGTFPDIAGHLISASVLSAPAALVMAKLMLPETEQAETMGQVVMHDEKVAVNAVDAAARGAGDGLMLALNVGAMLIAFLALVAMINFGVGWVGGLVGIEGLTMQVILGYVLWPLAWVMGVPAADCTIIAQLFGERFILNEFISYLHLAEILNSDTVLQDRSVIIATYGLCGFANLGSIGIQLGGIGGIAPDRRSDLALLGFKALIAGTLASFMTATVAGMLL